MAREVTFPTHPDVSPGVPFVGSQVIEPWYPDRREGILPYSGVRKVFSEGSLSYRGTLTVPATSNRRFALEMEVFLRQIHRPDTYAYLPTYRTGFADHGTTTRDTQTSNPAPGRITVRSVALDSDIGGFRVTLNQQDAEDRSVAYGEVIENPQEGDWIGVVPAPEEGDDPDLSLVRLVQIIGTDAHAGSVRTPFTVETNPGNLLQEGAVLVSPRLIRVTVAPDADFSPTEVLPGKRYGPWTFLWIEDRRLPTASRPVRLVNPTGQVNVIVGTPTRIPAVGRFSGQGLNHEVANEGDAVSSTLNAGGEMVFEASRPIEVAGFLRARNQEGEDEDDFLIVAQGPPSPEDPRVLAAEGVNRLAPGEPYTIDRDEFIQSAGGTVGRETVIQGNNSSLVRRPIAGNIHSGTAGEPGRAVLRVIGENNAGEESHVDFAFRVGEFVPGSITGGPAESDSQLEPTRAFVAATIRPFGKGASWFGTDHFAGPNPFTITRTERGGDRFLQELQQVGNKYTDLARNDLTNFPQEVVALITARDTVTRRRVTVERTYTIESADGLDLIPTFNGPPNQVRGGTTGEVWRVWLTGGDNPVIPRLPAAAGTLTVALGTPAPDRAVTVVVATEARANHPREGDWYAEFTRTNADTVDQNADVTFQAHVSGISSGLGSAAMPVEKTINVRCRAATTSEGTGPDIDETILGSRGDGTFGSVSRLVPPFPPRGTISQLTLNRGALRSTSANLLVAVRSDGGGLKDVRWDDWTVLYEATAAGVSGNLYIDFSYRSGDTAIRTVTLPYTTQASGNQPQTWIDPGSDIRTQTVGTAPDDVELSNRMVTDPDGDDFDVLDGDDFSYTPTDIATFSLHDGLRGKSLLRRSASTKAGDVEVTFHSRGKTGYLGKTEKIATFRSVAAPPPTPPGVAPVIVGGVTTQASIGLDGLPLHPADEYTVDLRNEYAAGTNGAVPDFSRTSLSVTGNIRRLDQEFDQTTGAFTGLFTVVFSDAGTVVVSGRIYESGPNQPRASVPFTRTFNVVDPPAGTLRPIWRDNAYSLPSSLSARRYRLYTETDPQPNADRITYGGPAGNLSLSIAARRESDGGFLGTSQHGLYIDSRIRTGSSRNPIRVSYLRPGVHVLDSQGNQTGRFRRPSTAYRGWMLVTLTATGPGGSDIYTKRMRWR